MVREFAGWRIEECESLSRCQENLLELMRSTARQAFLQRLRPILLILLVGTSKSSCPSRFFPIGTSNCPSFPFGDSHGSRTCPLSGFGHWATILGCHLWQTYASDNWNACAIEFSISSDRLPGRLEGTGQLHGRRPDAGNARAHRPASARLQPLHGRLRRDPQCGSTPRRRQSYRPASRLQSATLPATHQQFRFLTESSR
jgi:hypothetical protein